MKAKRGLTKNSKGDFVKTNVFKKLRGQENKLIYKTKQ